MNHLCALLGAGADSGAFEIGQSIGTAIGIAIAGLMCLGIPGVLVLSLIQYARTKKRGWLIALVASGVLSLIPAGLMLSGVGIGMYRAIKDRKQGASTLPADRIVATPEAGLKLRIAEHWRTLTGLNEQASIQVGNPAREEYLIVLSDAKSDYAGSLEEFATLTSETLLESLADGSATDMRKITLAGRDAFQRELSGQVQTTKIEYGFTAVEGTDHYYQILAWTLPSKKDAAFRVFSEVLGTCAVK